jgi:hypothetical protein
MDADAMYIIGILLSGFSYVGIFLLGYCMRSYIHSHRRVRVRAFGSLRTPPR